MASLFSMGAAGYDPTTLPEAQDIISPEDMRMVAENLPLVGGVMTGYDFVDSYLNDDLLGMLAAGVGVIPGGKAAQRAYEKTAKAYKLFTRGRDGKLYALFVDAQKPLETGKWMPAIIPQDKVIKDTKNGRLYVISKGSDQSQTKYSKQGTGKNVSIDDETRERLIAQGDLPPNSKAKSIKGVALRPGWHAGASPSAEHIGPTVRLPDGTEVRYRADDQVWAEVEMPADVDWQKEALKRAEKTKAGNIKVGTAHITDQIPEGGYYRYKTNPKMKGEWMIGGDLKINRMLSDDEVRALNEMAGTPDLPRLSELVEQYPELIEQLPTQSGYINPLGNPLLD